MANSTVILITCISTSKPDESEIEPLRPLIELSIMSPDSHAKSNRGCFPDFVITFNHQVFWQFKSSNNLSSHHRCEGKKSNSDDIVSDTIECVHVSASKQPNVTQQIVTVLSSEILSQNPTLIRVKHHSFIPKYARALGVHIINY